MPHKKNDLSDACEVNKHLEHEDEVTSSQVPMKRAKLSEPVTLTRTKSNLGKSSKSLIKRRQKEKFRNLRIKAGSTYLFWSSEYLKNFRPMKFWKWFNRCIYIQQQIQSRGNHQSYRRSWRKMKRQRKVFLAIFVQFQMISLCFVVFQHQLLFIQWSPSQNRRWRQSQKEHHRPLARNTVCLLWNFVISLVI